MGKEKSTTAGFGVIFWMILWGALSYIIYDGNPMMVAGIIILIALGSILQIVSIIPMAGVLLYWFIQNRILDFIILKTGLYFTWIITCILGINILLSLVITIISTIFLATILLK